VIVWVAASDARPLLALVSILAAFAIRGISVIVTRTGTGRSVFWSPWFFAVAAFCELVWLIARQVS
jgi:hypothetical protein